MKRNNIKSIKYIALFLLVIFISCSEKKKTITYIPVTEATDAYDLDGKETMANKNIAMQSKVVFNTVTNDSVAIIHHLDNSGFHFYNAVAFENEKKGAIVGGAGLKIRITTDGGLHWQENKFSKFANAFHSLALSKDTIFVVGESSYIYRSTNFGKQWEFFDTNNLINQYVNLNVKGEKSLKNYTPRFYKIKFYNNT